MENKKVEALLAVAQAYYDRGCDLQYDQRSMDRVLELTPRRRKMLPPEAATGQYTLFLDCSGFTSAAYYQAFGYMLPADLTWHIIDHVEPQVYYYELTHQETPEEMAAIEAEVRALLQPGDLITYQNARNSGHVMLCMDKEHYINVSQNGIEGSYDFNNRQNRYRETGGTFIERVDWLFQPKEDGTLRNFLFNPKYWRFAISRPLDMVGDPTPDALARLGPAKKLVCGVESSHPGGHHAVPGETVEYRVFVRNLNEEAKEVEVTFAAPKGASLQGADTVRLVVAPGEKAWATFNVTVEDGSALWLEGPEVTVNTLHVFARRVLLGKAVSEDQQSKLLAGAQKELDAGADALQAAARAYGAQGILMEDKAYRYCYTHFFLHDSTKGDVLSRRPQQPEKDLAVYSMFGGTGVITPEMGSTPVGPRTTHIDRRDLMPGDIILCSDDPYGKQAYTCLYTGRELVGQYEHDEPIHTIADAELDRFLDSLPGRFCYLLLRPWLAQ